MIVIVIMYHLVPMSESFGIIATASEAKLVAVYRSITLRVSFVLFRFRIPLHSIK
jgi:hypothetical protein